LSFPEPLALTDKEKSSQQLAAPLSFKHQLYCWQVALQHCLPPLQVDTGIYNLKIKILPTIFVHMTFFEILLTSIVCALLKATEINSIQVTNILFFKLLFTY
jgi:hypothetical protein